MDLTKFWLFVDLLLSISGKWEEEETASNVGAVHLFQEDKGSFFDTCKWTLKKL